MKHKPSTIEVHAGELLNQGITYLRSDDLERAEGAFTTSFEIYPTSAAIDGLGCVMLKKNEFAKSKGFFLRAQEIDSDYAPALHHLALVADLSGDKENAKKLYQEALLKTPERPELRNDFGALLYDLWSKEKSDATLAKQSKALFVQSELLGGNGIGLRNKESLFE